MPYIAMTPNTLYFLCMASNLADQQGMAGHAVFLHNFSVAAANSDRFVKIPGGEGVTVIPAVQALDNPLVRELVRDMAIVTGGEFIVAGMIPALELVAHNVAVYTRIRVIGEVGESFRMIECEHGQPCQNSQHGKRQRYPELVCVQSLLPVSAL